MVDFYRKIPICGNPASITDIDTEREVEPREVGMTAEGVREIWRAVEVFYRTRTQPAVSFCLMRHGKVVIHRSIGHRAGNQPGAPDGAPRSPLTTSTPYSIFSTSKAITAILMHILEDRDNLKLDDPVAKYVPGFGRHGKGGITVRHVLNHRAGLASLRGHEDLDLLDDWNAIVDIMCDARPAHPPGKWVAYHAITGGFILGEVARRATGKPLTELICQHIREPLGLSYLNYGVDAARVGDVAENAYTGVRIPGAIDAFVKRAIGVTFEQAIDYSNDPRFLTKVVPSANVVANAYEIARLFEVVLRKGRHGEGALLSPEACERLLKVSTQWMPDLTLAIPMRYAQGLMLGRPMASMYGPDTPDAFGHYGFMSNLGWSDPKRGLSAALLTSGKAMVGPHMLPFYDVLRQVSKWCEPLG